MNKKIFTIVSLLAVASIAQAREGFYVGGQAGASFLTRTPKKSDLRETFNTDSVRRERARASGGIVVGYNFDVDMDGQGQEWTIAPEVGFRYTQRAKYRANNVPVRQNGVLTRNNNVALSHQINVIDVLAVGTYRINPEWDVQFKAGMGVAIDKVRLTLTNPAVPGNDSLSKTRSRVRPEVGFGVGYMINPEWRLSVDALHMFGSKSRVNGVTTDQIFESFKKVPSLTSVTVGLQYMF